MTHDRGGSARPGRPPARPSARRDRGPRIRVAVLGVAAVVLVWTGHGVTWVLLSRTGALWLVDISGVLIAGVAAATLVLRSVRSWLIVLAALLVIVLI